MPLNVDSLRRHFPALARQQDGRPVAYFDGPAGTQVPQAVVAAVTDCLLRHNANCGAPFATSREADALLAEARAAAADLVGAADADEIAFGPNMTTLTLAVSRAIGRTWRTGDEVIVSRLDHDANVTPWVLAARDAGATVRSIEVRREDCTLDLGSFEAALSERTRLVAVGYASNAVGTINPVRRIVERARAAGALTWIDAVHFAPHGSMDVQQTGCDFLVCSAYKFFGPHVGILWGRRELLESIEPYKLRPAPEALPGRWMTGTQNHEGIAGVTAAIDYLAGIADQAAAASPDTAAESVRPASRRERLRRSFALIAAHERQLCAALLAGLERLSGFTVWGIRDVQRLHERVPTVSITHARRTPAEIAAALAARGMFVWPGNHYALPLTESLGLEPAGTLRIGLVHYNTEREVDRLLGALAEIA